MFGPLMALWGVVAWFDDGTDPASKSPTITP